MHPTNRIAVALGLKDTGSTLNELFRLRNMIAMAEIRLDLMAEFDLERLLKQSPCPLIITCRPVREGGNFEGSETVRLGILADACALGCAYVDIEWDSVLQFQNPGESTKIIVSRHFFDTMPDGLDGLYNSMRRQADIVKLVGFANHIQQSLPVLELMNSASTPLIAIAMGPSGLITRLLAPCFESCLLTYAAANSGTRTAPGQVSVREMIDVYKVHLLHDSTEMKVHLCTTAEEVSLTTSQYVNTGDQIHLPILVSSSEVTEVTRSFEQLTPRIRVAAFKPKSSAPQ